MSSKVDPNEFSQPGTRRIRALASSAGRPLVAGAGWDGHVYVWDVRARTRVFDFPTLAVSGGVSLALSANGSSCFVGTYYAWGASCVDLEEGRELWRRTDLKRFYGLATLPHETGVVACFDDRAAFTLAAQTGRTVERHVGLRAIGASRFDRWTLKYGRRFELISPTSERRRWNREGFALLAHAFSPDQCVVSETGSAVRARDVVSSRVCWTYLPKPGAHVIALEYSSDLGHFVALEYAYTDEGRANGPMVSLLHFDPDGRVRFRKAIREWPDAVFCENGAFVLNGLGELHDVRTGEVAHVFSDFPR